MRRPFPTSGLLHSMPTENRNRRPGKARVRSLVCIPPPWKPPEPNATRERPRDFGREKTAECCWCASGADVTDVLCAFCAERLIAVALCLAMLADCGAPREA